MNSSSGDCPQRPLKEAADIHTAFMICMKMYTASSGTGPLRPLKEAANVHTAFIVCMKVYPASYRTITEGFSYRIAPIAS